MHANIPKHARKVLASDIKIAQLWQQYLDGQGKPRNTAPVPRLWLDFAARMKDTYDIVDILPPTDTRPPIDETDSEPDTDDSEPDNDDTDDSEPDDDDTDDSEPDNDDTDDSEPDNDDTDDSEPDDDDTDDSEPDDDDTDDSEPDDDDTDDSEPDDSEPDDDDTDDSDTDTPPSPLDDLVRRIARQEANRAVRQHEASEFHASTPVCTTTPIESTPVAPKPIVSLDDTPTPYWFQEALNLLRCGQNVLLIGPSGCGKTHNAALLAQALDLGYCPLSFSGGIDESYLTGAPWPGENGSFHFVESSFVTACESGSLILADEIDAADPNVLLIWNSALRNRFLPLPMRTESPIAHVHERTLFLAAANTKGHGADRLFVGRNQLDEATLARFRNGQVIIDYDPDLERKLYHSDVVQYGHRLRARCRDQRGWTRDVSTADIEACARKVNSGLFDVVQAWYAYFQDWDERELGQIDIHLDRFNRRAEML